MTCNRLVLACMRIDAGSWVIDGFLPEESPLSSCA